MRHAQRVTLCPILAVISHLVRDQPQLPAGGQSLDSDSGSLLQVVHGIKSLVDCLRTHHDT